MGSWQGHTHHFNLDSGQNWEPTNNAWIWLWPFWNRPRPSAPTPPNLPSYHGSTHRLQFIKRKQTLVYVDGSRHGPSLVNFLYSLHSDLSALVRLNSLGELSTEFPLKSGVRQGCTLAPLLCIFYINGLTAHLSTSHRYTQNCRLPYPCFIVCWWHLLALTPKSTETSGGLLLPLCTIWI